MRSEREEKHVAVGEPIFLQDKRDLAVATYLGQPLREDKVTERDQHGLYQAVAPAVEGDLYLVPKVIE